MLENIPYYVGALAAKSLLDGREVHLLRMLYNLRIVLTDGPQGLFYEEIFCFHDVEAAWKAFAEWDGEGQPVGWFKDAKRGRYNRAVETYHPVVLEALEGLFA